MLRKFKEARLARAEEHQHAQQARRVAELQTEANRAFDAFTAAALDNSVSQSCSSRRVRWRIS
jgi:hypothetical protein